MITYAEFVDDLTPAWRRIAYFITRIAWSHNPRPTFYELVSLRGREWAYTYMQRWSQTQQKVK